MARRFFLAVFLLILSGCAGLTGSHDVDISLAAMQQSLQKKFPFNNRYLDLFDITVSNPQLTLQPQSNRIVTALDARVAPPFLKNPWEGKLVISGVLKIDAARHAVLLTDPRLENLTMDKATGTYTGKLARLGTLLAEDILNNMIIYQFKPEDFKHAGVQFLPTKITTRANGLVVSFVPVK
jgi:hypothetical protein